MKIKELRKMAGLTQKELADKLGVSRSTVSMWEIGESKPYSNMLPILAKVLSCGIADLFDGNLSKF